MSHRYVFVGGLHRSGTSLLTRLIGNHPQVASITDAPVPENEGCYLQGAIPHTARHGRPMHFATDPSQHLREGCRFDKLDTRLRIEADWHPWFQPDRPWRVEKSPVNLTRMRLYQQLFPLSQFIVVVRHPQAVAAAVAKWLPDPPARLIDHWIGAHKQLQEDLTYLHAAMVVRYEDLVTNPDRVMSGVFAFLSLPPQAVDMQIRNGNGDYPDTAPMQELQRKAVLEWGYGDGMGGRTIAPYVTHPLRAVADNVKQCLIPASNPI